MPKLRRKNARTRRTPLSHDVPVKGSESKRSGSAEERNTPSSHDVKGTKSKRCTEEERNRIVSVFKSVLRITPQTCNFLIDLGFRSIGDIAVPCNTPESLSALVNDLLKRRKKTLFNYTTAFRYGGFLYFVRHCVLIIAHRFSSLVVHSRVLWAARASDEERRLHPELFQCKSWSLKGMRARCAKNETESTQSS